MSPSTTRLSSQDYPQCSAGNVPLDYNSDGEVRQNDFQVELLPLHSQLLGESLLVSFPPLINMLKSSGSSYLISGPIDECNRGFAGATSPSRALGTHDTRTGQPTHSSVMAAGRSPQRLGALCSFGLRLHHPPHQAHDRRGRSTTTRAQKHPNRTAGCYPDGRFLAAFRWFCQPASGHQALTRRAHAPTTHRTGRGG